MKIFDSRGVEIPENIVEDIVLELFQKVNNSFESKRELPKRIDLINDIYSKYRKNLGLNLINIGLLEQKMEMVYNKELKEMGYELLNMYK